MDKQKRWIYKLLPRAFLPKPIEEELAAAAPVPVIVKAAVPLDQQQGGGVRNGAVQVFFLSESCSAI